jgi:hypothetical protein
MTEIFVEITIKKRYLFPESIRNSPKDLIKEFFMDFDINQHHATRDFYHIGGGDRLVNRKIIYKKIKNLKDLNKIFKKK